MIQSLLGLTQLYLPYDEPACITIVHAKVGDSARFGTSPGEGEVDATLRAVSDHVMGKIVSLVEKFAKSIAEQYSLSVELRWTDVFHATNNDKASSDYVTETACDLGFDIYPLQQPFAWSEDFGLLSSLVTKGAAFFGIGSQEDTAGTSCNDLHTPNFDFNDNLLPFAIIFMRTLVDKVLSRC